MKKYLAPFIEMAMAKQGHKMNVVQGLMDGRFEVAWSNGPFVYVDHAYFKRGWHLGNFRAVRDGIHLTEIIAQPSDRLARWDVEIKPWNKTGRNIILIELSPWLRKIYGLANWEEVTKAELRKHTDRPIIVKEKGRGDLLEMLPDAWAVVCFASVAGIEAALGGVPVFTTQNCPAWPVNAGSLSQIETPEYKDRLDWACSLSYATWNISELDLIDWRDYQYRLKEEACAS